MNKKKQHYVPVCYQINFLHDNGYIYYIDINQTKKTQKVLVKQTHPNSQCFIDYFYQITNNIKSLGSSFDNLDELFVEENVFKDFENRYRTIFDSLTKNKMLLAGEAKLFVKSIIQLKQRNPYFKNNVIENIKKSNHSDIVGELVKEASKDERFKNIGTKILLELANNLDNLYVNHPHYSSFMHLYGLINRNYDTSPELLKGLTTMLNSKWLLLVANDIDTPFIYTDNPGFGVDLKTNTNKNTKFDDNFIYFLPISYKYCLCINSNIQDIKYKKKRNVKTLDVKRINDEEVNQINNDNIAFASNRIFSNSKEYLKSKIKLTLAR